MGDDDNVITLIRRRAELLEKKRPRLNPFPPEVWLPMIGLILLHPLHALAMAWLKAHGL